MKKKSDGQLVYGVTVLNHISWHVSCCSDLSQPRTGGTYVRYHSPPESIIWQIIRNLSPDASCYFLSLLRHEQKLFNEHI